MCSSISYGQWQQLQIKAALARYDMNTGGCDCKAQGQGKCITSGRVQGVCGLKNHIRKIVGHFPPAMSPAGSDKGFAASQLIELYLVLSWGGQIPYISSNPGGDWDICKGISFVKAKTNFLFLPQVMWVLTKGTEIACVCFFSRQLGNFLPFFRPEEWFKYLKVSQFYFWYWIENTVLLIFVSFITTNK